MRLQTRRWLPLNMGKQAESFLVAYPKTQGNQRAPGEENLQPIGNTTTVEKYGLKIDLCHRSDFLQFLFRQLLRLKKERLRVAPDFKPLPFGDLNRAS
jgi:hypothetical protein